MAPWEVVMYTERKDVHSSHCEFSEPYQTPNTCKQKVAEQKEKWVTLFYAQLHRSLLHGDVFDNG